MTHFPILSRSRNVKLFFSYDLGLNSSHTPCNDLYAGQCEDCDGQCGLDQSPAPPPHDVLCLMSGRWFTPDWRESDVSVTIMQEMRKHTAERRRTLSHGAESRAARGEEVSWARDSQDKQRDITFNAKHYFHHLQISLERDAGLLEEDENQDVIIAHSSPLNQTFF